MSGARGASAANALVGINLAKLVRLLQDWSPPFPGFYLYYPGRRQMPPALRAFIDFLQSPVARTTKQR